MSTKPSLTEFWREILLVKNRKWLNQWTMNNTQAKWKKNSKKFKNITIRKLLHIKKFSMQMTWFNSRNFKILICNKKFIYWNLAIKLTFLWNNWCFFFSTETFRSPCNSLSSILTMILRYWNSWQIRITNTSTIVSLKSFINLNSAFW